MLTNLTMRKRRRSFTRLTRAQQPGWSVFATRFLKKSPFILFLTGISLPHDSSKSLTFILLLICFSKFFVPSEAFLLVQKVYYILVILILTMMICSSGLKRTFGHNRSQVGLNESLNGNKCWRQLMFKRQQMLSAANFQGNIQALFARTNTTTLISHLLGS